MLQSAGADFDHYGCSFRVDRALIAHYPISDLSIVEPELESVIRQIYEQRQVVL
jgi:hypothetical protein